jgi:hypothetical protein
LNSNERSRLWPKPTDAGVQPGGNSFRQGSFRERHAKEVTDALPLRVRNENLRRWHTPSIARYQHRAFSS